MKIRNPLLMKTIGVVGATVLRRLMGTIDLRIRHPVDGPHPTDPRERRFLYLCWHEHLIAPTALRSRISVLISQHADGELITQFVRHLRVGVVRGSTTRGGAAAMMNLIDASKKTHLLITPDGPRGPRRRIQPGSIFIASRTGLPIVPCGVGFTNAWRANSWDRFAVPLPFSGIRGIFGEPIVIPPNLEPRQLDRYVALVQDRMTQVNDDAEAWAAKTRRRESTLALAKSA